MDTSHRSLQKHKAPSPILYSLDLCDSNTQN